MMRMSYAVCTRSSSFVLAVENLGRNGLPWYGKVYRGMENRWVEVVQPASRGNVGAGTGLGLGESCVPAVSGPGLSARREGRG